MPCSWTATAVLFLAQCAASTPAPFPVNFTSDVHVHYPYPKMSTGKVSGALPTGNGTIRVSCSPDTPQRQRYHMVSSADQRSWTMRCDLGKIFVSDDSIHGDCCFKNIMVNHSDDPFCQTCPWDTTAWEGRKYSCGWAPPVPRNDSGGVGLVERYVIPGPCDDYLWLGKNVSVELDVTKSEPQLPAVFRRITYVKNAMVPSDGCRKAGRPCQDGAICCAAGGVDPDCFSNPRGGLVCSDLTPPDLEEVDTFNDFKAVPAFPDDAFAPPGDCDTPCGGRFKHPLAPTAGPR